MTYRTPQMDHGIRSYKKLELPLKTKRQGEKALRESPTKSTIVGLDVPKNDDYKEYSEKKGQQCKIVEGNQSGFTKEINKKTRGLWALSLSSD